MKYWQSQLARRLAASPPRLAYSSASQHRNMGKRAFRRANVIIGSHSRSRTPRILRPNFRASSKNSTEMPKSRSCSGRSRQTGSRQGTHGGFLAALHQGPFFKHAGMRPDTATGLALRTVRKLDWALRPILRSMEDARDFYRLLCDLIDDDVGQRSENQFASAWHANAGASHVEKLAQDCASFIDRSGDAARGFGTVAIKVLADALQILSGWQRPSECQNCKNR